MPTFALLPAAGHSQRMGQPKLGLVLHGLPLWQHSLNTLRAAAIRQILVVLAPHVASFQPLIEKEGASVLVLPDATPHMRATVEQGLRWIAEHWHPGPNDCWLLSPADHPLLDPALVPALQLALAAQLDKSIALPTHGAKRGHPALIRWNHAAQLHTFAPDLGLNTYLRQYPGDTLELPWPTPDVLTDLNTPEDYQRLLEKPLP